MADVVASLGTVDFRMDEWGVDVAGGRVAERGS